MSILFALSLLLISPQPIRAIYDPLSVPNNKWGIHILETSELGKAAEFVNSSGGDWGYVTIPIRANERDYEKWANFMTECRRLHLIPILRIATFPKEDKWMAPNEYDLVDFANFLDELPWPIENRYIIVYNEPNHQGEWGGFVYPEEYARILERGLEIFHQKNSNFFVISAGLDASAPNGANSMNSLEYLRIMINRYPNMLTKVDGFSAHAYGNPAFATYPNLYSPVNIGSYRFEQNYLRRFGIDNLKIFITEAGWNNIALGDAPTANYYKQAFEKIWTENNIVAITPFLLAASGGPFEGFSFTQGPGGDFKPFAKELQKLPKVKGGPKIAAITNTQPQVPEPKNNILSNLNTDTGDSLEALLQKILDFFNTLKY